MSQQVIVVGGGLSGLSAAHTVMERGGNVLVLDKNSFMGGNSTKATSGINGTLTRTQVNKGIKDSVEAFTRDTAVSAAGGKKDAQPSDLAKVLCGKSGPAVEWLQDAFQLDLSLVARLGGHSFPRTHRGKERFPGMTITYALMEKLEEIADKKDGRARFILKARVTKFIKDQSGAITGVQYEKDGKTFTEHGPVIIATGGYGADFSEGSLLSKYRPDLSEFSTTNGAHCTGDGIKMALDVGADAVDMKYVQVHPTGLVDPAEPNAKTKFLAAEALRGVGGILLTREGKRFCNELGRRDYVSGEMRKNPGPFRLVMNSKAGKEIEWHIKHYVGRGLMKEFKTGHDLAREMGISASVLEDTFKAYNAAAREGKDQYGKVFFHNLPLEINDTFYVSFVTPVVHYTMGGLKISPEAEVCGPNGPVPGLWATGEVCGGVHGVNRLGGSSLLDCVVFGRVAGDSAARYLLNQFMSQRANRRLGSLMRQFNPNSIGTTISQPGVQTLVDIDPSTRRVSLDISWTDDAGSSAVAGPSATASSDTKENEAAVATDAKPAKVQRQMKEYTVDEVAKHNTKDDCWVIINGQVLDVTKFLPDHPGGAKAILLYAGKEASEEFNMLHKPDVIDKYTPESVIGTIKK